MVTSRIRDILLRWGVRAGGWMARVGVFVVLAAVAVSLGFASNALAAEYGQISGRVTDASTHDPIEGITVCARPAGEESGGLCAESGHNGEYTVPYLAPGAYHVGFLVVIPNEHELDYASQYYNDKSHRAEAETVTVTAGQTTSGIDAAMLPGGKISGVVTDAVTQAPLEGVQVCADGTPEERSASTTRCDLTNASGEYMLSPFVTGDYVVGFAGPYGGPLVYVPQFYDNQQSELQANLVSVTTGLTTMGVDVAMQRGGVIAGRVTAAVTGAAIEGVGVCALPAGQESRERCAETNANGEYTLSPVKAGQDVIEFGWSFGENKSYQREYYNGKTSYSEADPLTVEAGATITGIDAALYLPGERPVNTSPAPVTALPSGLTALATPLITTTSPAITTPLLTVVASRLVVSGSAAPVHVACRQAACQGSIELVAQVAAKRHKGKTAARKQALVLATGSFSLGKGRSGTVVLRLTGVGRKRLARAKHHPIAAKLILSVKGGKTTTRSVLAV
jgi:Carboxypeptidase regulatory-like domain